MASANDAVPSRGVRIIFRQRLSQMAPANDAVLCVSGFTSYSDTKTFLLQHAQLGFKQAMTSLWLASQYMEYETTTIEVDLSIAGELLGILSERSTKII